MVETEVTVPRSGDSLVNWRKIAIALKIIPGWGSACNGLISTVKIEHSRNR
jgi:hypothetical protein